jgi:glyoxylase-like metal-dependent hydrolase (beta-lactamase superfamily II)
MMDIANDAGRRGAMTAKPFASTEDTAEKKTALSQLGPGLYAYTADGDPNSGIIVGDDGVMVVDAQPTPAMATELIGRVAKVTDKPIKYVLLSHHHASRTLGASAFKAAEIIASDVTRGLIAERGKADIESETGRFPRLFRAADTVPGPTWPTLTFPDEMSVWLGRREVRILHIGRGHTAGDVIAVVPDAGVVFASDLVEYQIAPYCGDAHFTDWPATLDNLAELQANAIVPGRGPALTTPQTTAEAIEATADFIATLYGSVQESVAKGRSLKEAFDFVRLAMDPKFRTLGLYEHRLPFSVARAYDEARGIERPVIWTAERDREMWAALQG